MKLSLLHETTTTGAIAAFPSALGGPPAPISNRKTRRKTKLADGMVAITDDKNSYGHDSRQPKTSATQPFDAGKGHKKRWWDNFAQKVNQDERLLPQFRGKGY